MIFDAFFFVSFGGPDRPEDIEPFLDNVLRGKNVPAHRKKEVVEHYMRFGGKSPINEQNQHLIEKIKQAFARNKIDLPIYWGNRNWHPYIEDAIKAMQHDGRKRALAYFTSSFSSYSGCRQYRENIEAACANIVGAPEIAKLRMPFNHPQFIQAAVENIQEAYQKLLRENSEKVFLLFTAHSIPLAMSENCDYVKQLQHSSKLIAQHAGFKNFDVVYQSRSGPAHVPWLDPDVCTVLPSIKNRGYDGVLVMPLGFVTDHMEVLFDLDVEAKQKAHEVGLAFSRAQAVGHHPLYVDMLVDLVKERLDESPVKKTLGDMGPWHDVCPPNCCRYIPKRPS